ncbi:MAG TPA: nuclear transport factor 2 family protein, partial [Acidimicrobiales bacterium]
MDKDEVIDLVHRYSYCVDHRLYDEVASLFTEDCVVDYGPDFGPPIRGRLALRKMFGHPSAGYRATSHHNANVLVTFDDVDHATVRTSVYAWHQRRDLTTPRLWGYYHDTVERGPDGWLIATRQLRVL